MKRGFTISTIVYLSFVLVTVVAWVGFELYHQGNNVDIPTTLEIQADKPLPTSFDRDTLIKLYANKENFYNLSENTPQ